MMRILLLIIITVSISGCKKDSMCNCLQSTGEEITGTRNISSFTQIDLHNNIDLVYHTDTFNHVSVTAGKKLIDGITTEVENGILVLRNKNRCNWTRSFSNTFVVDVWIKQLDRITVYDASSNIRFADTLKQDEFHLNSWSSTGDYYLKLNIGTAYLELHTGPADIYAEGEIGVAYVYSAGYGKIDMDDLDADDVYIANKGTNDLYIKAHNRIDAEISYLGNIYYKGNPSQVDQTITNSGRLIHLN